MIHHDQNENINLLADNVTCYPFGLLFDDQNKKEFSFYFTPFNRNLRENFIEKIYFFENLDLFYENRTLKKLTNKTMNILELYYNYKEGNFKNTAITFVNEFIKTTKFENIINDLDLIIHLFNTRNLPIDHEIHPLSRHLFTYRNKIVTFYSTINYFIYIYDIKGKTLPRYGNLFVDLIKNTFSNGYVIQSNKSLLVSTFLFKQDFESEKESLQELVYSFKLEISIHENLNLVPFSFYQLPASTYYNTEEENWMFPQFKEQNIKELLTYQIKNLELEKNRLKSQEFKRRLQNFRENLTKEIQFLQYS